jgi:leucyl-tRNA synthetase
MRNNVSFQRAVKTGSSIPNGKIKGRFNVSPTISDADFEAAALAHPDIVAELAGATPKKVIARAPKLVNIVL